MAATNIELRDINNPVSKNNTDNANKEMNKVENIEGVGFPLTKNAEMFNNAT